jgi:hypothetical protein
MIIVWMFLDERKTFCNGILRSAIRHKVFFVIQLVSTFQTFENWVMFLNGQRSNANIHATSCFNGVCWFHETHPQ